MNRIKPVEQVVKGKVAIGQDEIIPCFFCLGDVDVVMAFLGGGAGNGFNTDSRVKAFQQKNVPSRGSGVQLCAVQDKHMVHFSL